MMPRAGHERANSMSATAATSVASDAERPPVDGGVGGVVDRLEHAIEARERGVLDVAGRQLAGRLAARDEALRHEVDALARFAGALDERARERQVLVDVEHVVDEHAGIGDGDEVAFAEAPLDDERGAGRKRIGRGRRRREERRMVGDDVDDADRQLRRQGLARDGKGAVAVVAIDVGQLATQPSDLERRQRRVRGAEVVGEHGAPTRFEITTQHAAVDGGARIDEPDDVARLQRRPVERLGGADAAAGGDRLVAEASEPVPLARVEPIVAAGGECARRSDENDEGGGAPHISPRKMLAPRSSSRSAVARCASRLVASTTK